MDVDPVPELHGDGVRDVTPYHPGIPLVEVGKGTFLRFLPASVVAIVGSATAFGVTPSAILASGPIALFGFAGLMTLGFGGGLLALRRWLYPDAMVSGRRSVVAGILSPLALFVAGVLGPPVSSLGVSVLMFLVGLVLALGMFFAWLTPTPEEMRG